MDKRQKARTMRAEGRSYPEIAAALKLSEKAARLLVREGLRIPDKRPKAS